MENAVRESFLIKSFQNFNKSGIPDHGIIGDKRQIKISGSGGNQPVMQLGDVVDLRSGFKNLKAQRLKLIILTLEKIFGLKQADIDPVLLEQIEYLH